ncbi:MAG: hypothetical protein HY774_24055 [Acidobacteria bacterium]|nr:hypothetical protein [Acidobacteriota bacterium]
MSWIPNDLKESIFNGLCTHIDTLGTRFLGEQNQIWFEQWRTDRASKKELSEALERAARRLVERFDSPEAQALIQDRYFYEREDVKAAIGELVAHPFDQDAVKTVERILSSVMPDHSGGQQADAAQYFLQCLLEELCSVKKLRELLSLVYQQKSVELETTHVELSQKTLDLLDRRLPIPPDIQKAQQQYLDYVVNLHCTLGSQGIMQTARSVTLPLDEVFVRLTCEKEETDPTQLKRKVSKLRSGIVEGNVPSEISIMVSAESDLAEDWFLHQHLQTVEHSDGIELSTTIANHSYVVILGDPGSGKTTLLRFLALHFVRQFRDSGSTGIVTDKDGQLYGRARFPILVRISAYAEALRLNRNTALRDFLTVPFGDTGIELIVLKGVFESVLQQGKALLLLDGLDEVIEHQDRNLISQRISSLVSAVPRENRFVVTSRIAGYRVARLGGDFQQFTLRKFQRPQIETFLNRWCVAVERFHRPDLEPSELSRSAQPEIDGILQAVDENRGVMELASNPLMLTILALIHRNGSRLPSRRIELYDLAVKTLLKDWQIHRGLDSKQIVKESEVQLFLAPLAYWIHQEKPTGLVKTSEVKAKLMQFLAHSRQVSVEDETIEEAVDDFLRRVREHTGVFVERTADRYGFLHLTFEEYFVAREITRRARESAAKMYPYRHHPRWREAILLAIGYISTDRPEDASELIQTAILGKGEEAQKLGFAASLFEEVLHRDLLVAYGVWVTVIQLNQSFANKS